MNLNQETTATATPTDSAKAAPNPEKLKVLGGAFMTIQNSNNAILLHPGIPKPEVADKDGVIDEVDIDDINSALKVAQGNATYWQNDVSANMQKQLQVITSHASLYNALAPMLQGDIKKLGKATKDNPPSKALISSIKMSFDAIETSIDTYLYGGANKESDPDPKSILGVYNQITDYRGKVSTDETSFKGFVSKALNSETGINAKIKNLTSEISSLEDALKVDGAMTTGGMLAAAGAAQPVIWGAALVAAPFTGGFSLALAVPVSIIAVPVGIAAAVYGGQDLVRSYMELNDKKMELAKEQAELAAIKGLESCVSAIAGDLDSVYKALGPIITSWQQMKGNIGLAKDALKPVEIILNGQLSNKDVDYSALSTLLTTMMVTPAENWTKASDMAQLLLASFITSKNVVVKDVQKEVPSEEVLKDLAKAA